MDDLNELRIIELEKRVELQAQASNLAIKLAADDLKTRLDSMNEFRLALKDQAATFVTRVEIERDREDIRNLQLAQAKVEGKASQMAVNVAFILNAIAIIVAVLSEVGDGRTKIL